MLIRCFKYLDSRKLMTDIVINNYCFKKISCTGTFLRRCILSTNIFKIRTYDESFLLKENKNVRGKW